MSASTRRPWRHIFLSVVFCFCVLVSPKMSLAANWQVIGSSEEIEISIDIESVVRDGSIVTYWDRYRSFKIADDLDYALGQIKIDCSRRLRRSIYSIEYYRNGRSASASTDGGWKPIAPGTISDAYRRYLCES